MFESVNRRTDALTDGRPLKSHPINSPCEPLAQLSKKLVQGGLKYIGVITLYPL